MTSFQKRVAVQIALVSLLLACLASSIAWLIAIEDAEATVVSLATEESSRLMDYYRVDSYQGEEAIQHAQTAAQTITGGLFDIAEIYDRNGERLAESVTARGEQIEPLLPPHVAPSYNESFYESLHAPDGTWILRVFVPLYNLTDPSQTLRGYFEGVRAVPRWQEQQISASALHTAVLAGCAALLCGLVIYPVVVRLSNDNQRKARDVLDSHLSMMEALGRAIARRDSDTGVHNYRVAWTATQIAEAMDIKDNKMQALIIGSFLHDVGKIGIPDAILLKPGRLDDEEMAVMRTHVSLGAQIIDGIGWLEEASDVVEYHHEKWDGTGYPYRLCKESIPLSARIFAVADVFDALCSKRPYKAAMPFDKAMSILHKDRGSHFDPSVIDAFSNVAERIYRQLDAISEEDARLLLLSQVHRYFDE